jgi:hypothetical protein
MPSSRPLALRQPIGSGSDAVCRYHRSVVRRHSSTRTPSGPRPEPRGKLGQQPLEARSSPAAQVEEDHGEQAVHEFDDLDLHFAERLASSLTLALTNARLHRSLRQELAERQRAEAKSAADLAALRRTEQPLREANARLAEADRRKDEFLAVLSQSRPRGDALVESFEPGGRFRRPPHEAYRPGRPGTPAPHGRRERPPRLGRVGARAPHPFTRRIP